MRGGGAARAAAIAAVAVAAACSRAATQPTTTPSGTAPAATSTAATGAPITIGVITPLTGPDAADFGGTRDGVVAAVARANISGGVNGHKIEFEMLDDRSTAHGAAAAVQQGIKNGDFALLAVSPTFGGGYRAATSAHEPVVGAGIDNGPEWSNIAANPTLFDVLGGADPTQVATTLGDAFGVLGVHQVGAVSDLGSSSSSELAKGAIASAAHAGFAAGYVSTVAAGTRQVTAAVSGVATSRTDGLALPVEPTTVAAIAGGLAKDGAATSVVAYGGYGGDVLQSARLLRDDQGVYFATVDEPAELNATATQQFQHDLNSYAGSRGEPTFSQYQGYQVAGAFLYGLSLTGPDPTRASFVRALRGATWNANGLTDPVDFSAAGTTGGGTGPGNCLYFPQLSGHRFVINPRLNPVCGRLIPNLRVSP